MHERFLTDARYWLTPPGSEQTSSALGTFIIEYQYAAG